MSRRPSHPSSIEAVVLKLRQKNVPEYLIPNFRPLIAYGKPIVAKHRAAMARVEADRLATPFEANIADAEKSRV